MEVTRQQVQETDARKARNERSLALLIPIPPLETGKEAWAHVSSSSETLVIVSKAFLMTLSNSARR
jgi:hypothetical protein